LRNHADYNHLGGSATSQSQLREALCEPRIMTRQMQLCLVISKVGFPKETEHAWLLSGSDRIHDYSQILAVEVRRQIQTRGPEVKYFDIFMLCVFAAKSLYDQRAKAVISKEDVSQADHADAPFRHARALTHNTLTWAIS
jgi:hypothetical protein